MRTCILCLPRSGGQYCENLIASLDSQCMRLGEYLEGWNESDYLLDENNRLVKENINSVISPFAINSKYLHRLELLKNADKEQNFTMRLFVFDDYVLTGIVDSLAESGFAFASLQRDFYSIAMSYILAFNYAIQGNPIWTINSQISNPVTVHIPSTKRVLDRIYAAFNNWNNNLAKLNIEYKQFNYDTLVNDITDAFGSFPNYQGNKTVTHDYLTHIVNKDDVVKMIDSYASGL